MNASKTPFEVRELQAALGKLGLIAADDPIELDPYPAAFARRPDQQRWHYRVSTGQKNLCHLIVGRNLADTHTRAGQFTKACPALACRPLFFWEEKNALGFLCLEHFDGQSLDHLAGQNTCPAVDWLNHAREAQNQLSRTRVASTSEAMAQEIENLLDEACNFPGLSDFDRELLRGPIAGIIRAQMRQLPVCCQWSNGDFIGKNILVNTRGEIRLIDYEYAGSTHFIGNDWLRFAQFSLKPAGAVEDLGSIVHPVETPAQSARFWVHHLTQLKSAAPSSELEAHIAETFSGILRNFGRVDASSAPSQSLILASASSHATGVESSLAKAMSWAQSLEKELKAAQEKFAALTAEHAERTRWAFAIETELNQTREIVRKQESNFLDRTTWALSLQQENEHLKQVAHQLDALRRQVAEFMGSIHGSDMSQTPPAPCNQAIAPFDDGDLLVFLRSQQVELAESRTALAASGGDVLNAKFEIEAAKAREKHLTGALRDAQIHVDGLLRQVAAGHRQINTLQAKLTAPTPEQPI